MSTISLASLLSGVQQTTASSSTSTAANASASTADFAATLKLRLAEFESQSLDSLTSVSSDSDKNRSGSAFQLNGTTLSSASTGSDIYALLGAASTTAAGAVASTGYNMSLADPVSAYNMMSLINESEVKYKAQYAELSQMGEAITSLSQSAATLGGIVAQTDSTSVTTQLQAFVDSYNAWIDRFGASVETNGVLAGTQAAEVSLYELETSVENRFNGAASGFHGLSDLGVTVDESTGLLNFDSSVLASALSDDASGVVATLKDFSSSFTTAANLLTSDGNFVDARLDNLDRAIDYIGANKTSLQSEFGNGNAATPSVSVAAALDTYNSIYADPG